MPVQLEIVYTVRKSVRYTQDPYTIAMVKTTKGLWKGLLRTRINKMLWGRHKPYRLYPRTHFQKNRKAPYRPYYIKNTPVISYSWYWYHINSPLRSCLCTVLDSVSLQLTTGRLTKEWTQIMMCSSPYRKWFVLLFFSLHYAQYKFHLCFV